jgi:hypothetical protein
MEKYLEDSYLFMTITILYSIEAFIGYMFLIKIWNVQIIKK